MKFLLTQRLIFKKEGPFYLIFPNQFSKEFIKLASKRALILDKNESWNGKYKQVQSYEMLENDFKLVYRTHRAKIERLRKKFYSRSYLEQLILLLEYIFTRNNRAKEVRKRSAKWKAYDDKEDFLKMALDIAAKVQNDAFSYGWQLDPGTINHEYVYYFQVGKQQCSFHSSILYNEVPKFQGKWIGYKNPSFPFKVSPIKL